MLMCRIINTLPDEYFDFKSVWESVSKEERSVDNLTQRLRLLEIRIQQRDECSASSSTALMANAYENKQNMKGKATKSNEKFQKTRETRECYFCHRKGHLAKDCSRNVMSLQSTLDKGFEMKMDKKGCKLFKTTTGEVIVEGKRLPGGLYGMLITSIKPENAAEVNLAKTQNGNMLQLWHERFGHQNKRHVQKWLKEQGIDAVMDNEPCEACIYGKQHRLSFVSREQYASTQPGNLIHVDVCGPMQEVSKGGMRYFVCFKDDFTKYRSVYFLKEKSQVIEKLEQFLLETKTTGHIVKEILTDGGKEFVNKETSKITNKYGINHRITMPYTPQQNGSAERENRTLIEAARSMIYAKNMSLKLWAEAVNTATYVLNRTGPTQIEGKTPYELWFDKKPAVDHLRIFRTECFVHVPDEKRRKLDAKSEKEGLVPKTYKEAMDSPNAQFWKEAMIEEMNSLTENDVYECTTLPPGQKPIDCKWVLKTKLNSKGEITRYKARLVAKGFAQKKGIDYEETFSPVARHDTIRTLLAIAANEDLKLVQFDIKTAFLYGDLQDQIYIKQPEGFNNGTDLIWKLKKSLYGLKQSPRCWNQKIVNFMKEICLKESTADPCLFFRKTNDHLLIIAIYVGDGIIAGTNEQEIKEFLDELMFSFKITSEPLNYFLGIEIERQPDGSIFINQKAYIKRILEKFNMSQANKVGTPTDNSTVPGEAEILENVPFREAIGSLMHLSYLTRPDITFALNKVSQKLAAPTKYDWEAVKRIFKYLVGTTEYGIMYQKGHKVGVLESFSDADFAGDPETRRSTSGVVCKLAGGVISWLSQKQRSVSLSTTEAELVAASNTAKEVIWLNRLFSEISPLKEQPIIKVDNASTIKLIKNPEFHKRTKHIEVRHYFVREMYQEEVLWNQFIHKIESSPKDFWRKTKPIRKKTERISSLVTNGKTLLTNKEIGNELAEHFSNQFSKEKEEDQPNITYNHQQEKMLTMTTPNEVKEVIKYLANHKAPGHDNITPQMAKNLPIKWIVFLAGVFNAALHLCYYPKVWKHAIIIPIPKKSAKSPEDLRPISLLPTIGKIYERIILRRLQMYLDNSNFIIPQQFGFRRGHSTTHQLIAVLDYIQIRRSHKEVVGAVFLDFAKAFDRVWHNGLIKKLTKHQFPSDIINFMQNYLQGRTFSVKQGNFITEPKPIQTGVPQGSILGPYLFNIYINDIPLHSKCKLKLFADDTAILFNSKSVNLLVTQIQNYLNDIIKWCDEWKLDINPTKTQAIVFPPRDNKKFKPQTNLTVNSSTISWADHAKYLGVTLDSKLKFNLHVQNTIRKAKIAKISLSSLLNFKSNLTTKHKFTLYKTCILPIITYALPVWGKYITPTDKKRIDAFMRICLRTTIGAPFNLSNKILKEDLNQPNIEEMYQDSATRLFSQFQKSSNPTIQEIVQNQGDLSHRIRRPGPNG
ncbi:hypothetical protein LAZ67_5002251 [Cordylochernes scorpioides]|uniref:Uncharacterized protein n=1 Tax=Cordylochernes scorpioides TaxID=51811 RepID=A0ABY6KHD1_9ARAC|nr:hypothetical protein LAZ67_5002251 [Cordylochernes scorpioides]